MCALAHILFYVTSAHIRVFMRELESNLKSPKLPWLSPISLDISRILPAILIFSILCSFSSSFSSYNVGTTVRPVPCILEGYLKKWKWASAPPSFDSKNLYKCKRNPGPPNPMYSKERKILKYIVWNPLHKFKWFKVENNLWKNKNTTRIFKYESQWTVKYCTITRKKIVEVILLNSVD